MEAKGNHAPRGYFQDINRFRKLIDPELWDSIRYFEAAVEIFENGKKQHRIIVASAGSG